MNKQEVIALFADDVESRKKAVRVFVMDKTNSYEDRLDVWKSTPDHLRTNDNWIFHHPTLSDEDWFDYSSWSRHEDISLIDVPEYNDWGYEESEEYDEAKVIEFYTGCMDKGFWGFNFDW
jgi:hypothetical protein